MTHELVRDEEIISISVVDSDGYVIDEKIFDDIGEFKEGGILFIPERNVYNTAVESAGEKVGQSESVFSGKLINKELAKVLLVTIFSQLAVFVGLIITISYFFRSNVGKRINVIQEKVSQVKSGDLTVDIPSMKEDEIGHIGKGLSFLIESLSGTIERIKDTSNNVFKATKQLDDTFENVSRRVEDQKLSTDEVADHVDRATSSQNQIAENTEDLLNSLRENVSSLHEMRNASEDVSSSASKLFASTEISYSSVDEMSQQARNIKDRTFEVLSSLQETSASVSEITQSLQEVKKGSKETSAQVEKVSSIISGVGKSSVNEATKGMTEIEEEVGRTFEILKKLSLHSKDIEKILKVIKEVTEKTNLLSLNAAIISSQAGEYGKSFSVIADEMKGLAERTESSTRDIAEIVEIIQAHIKETFDSFKVEKQKVEKGNKLVSRVGETLEEIFRAAEISSEMAKRIEMATDEEAAGLVQITSALDVIKNETEQVSGAVDEQNKGITYLLENVGEVKEIAEIVNRAITEQAKGVEHITSNIDIANDKLSEITSANTGQKEIVEQIMNEIRKIQESGDDSLKGVNDISLFFEGLRNDSEALNRDMSSFRLKNGK
jgi:methyl-accepting chemotaxis protein